MAEGDESANNNNDALLQSEEQQTTKEEGKDPSDNLTPDHPRFKEVIADNHDKQRQIDELKASQAELEAKIAARQEATGDDDLTADEEKAIDKIALGLSKRGKVVTPEDFNRERQALQFERLSGKHDGSDGYPKFIPVDVQAFAKRRGISDLEDAYFIMNKESISQVDARKMAKTIEAPDSEKPTGKEKESPKQAVTPEEIAKMSDEEYEQHRDSLLASMKPKPSL